MKKFIEERFHNLDTTTLEILEDDAPLPRAAKYAGMIIAGAAGLHGVHDFLNQEYGGLVVDAFGVACGTAVARASHLFETVVHQELETRQVPTE